MITTIKFDIVNWFEFTGKIVGAFGIGENVGLRVGGGAMFGLINENNKFLVLSSNPELIANGVTQDFTKFWTWIFVNPLFCCHTKAMTPAAWGEDMEVPDSVCIADGFPIHADVTSTPGALKETQDPKLLNEGRKSLISLDATDKTFGFLDGLYKHASSFSLPAATATAMLFEINWLTAESIIDDALPPKERFATNFFVNGSPPRKESWLLIIYIIPDEIVKLLPWPEPSSTLIPFNRIFLHTP